MPSPRRTRVVSMPTKPPESPLEVAYNSAVQSFVRRDHVTTHAGLGRLLKLTDDLEPTTARWYGSDRMLSEADAEAQMWRFRVLKLLISAYASLYSDPPHRVENLPPTITRYLPPASPDLILEHAFDICQNTLHPTESSATPLPPQLMSTLVLAALKLQPAAPALAFARRRTEAWLADLPGNWHNTSSDRNAPLRALDCNHRERNRESYLKVVELFVGEVLAREGEFEMARAFLDGDEMLGSKRKEALYRQLRSIESKASQQLPPPQSPSASLVLPTPTSSRSHRPSSSSSSSERTARPKPAAIDKVSSTHGTPANGKGKKKAETGTEEDAQSAQTASTVPLPREIRVNSSTNSSLRRTATSGVQRNLQTILDLIPAALKQRLTSPPFFLSYIVPIPLVIILLLGWLKRSRRRGGAATAAAGVIGAGDVRQRLEEVTRRAGDRGLRAWIGHWIKWWLTKLAGVWKMGTTLTYL